MLAFIKNEALFTSTSDVNHYCRTSPLFQNIFQQVRRGAIQRSLFIIVSGRIIYKLRYSEDKSQARSKTTNNSYTLNSTYALSLVTKTQYAAKQAVTIIYTFILEPYILRPPPPNASTSQNYTCMSDNRRLLVDYTGAQQLNLYKIDFAN